MIVNIHDAKSTLSRLLKAAMEGEEVIIAKAGKPLVRLQPIPGVNRSGPGRFEGEIEMDDFFAPLPEEELQAWEG